MSKSFWNRILSSLALIVGLWLIFDLVVRFVGEWLWFEEVGYVSVFLLRLKTQVGLWAIAFFPSAAFLFGNLAIAQRLKYSRFEITKTLANDSDYQPKSFGLRWLLTLVVLLSVLSGVILIYYLHAMLSFWQPLVRFPSVSIQLPPWLPLLSLPQQLGQLLPIPIPYWQVAVVWGLSIALGLASLSTAILASPQFWLKAIALAISFSIAVIGSQRWDTVLQYFYPTSFGTVDPLFQRDISFYVFSLPVWELLKFWILGLVLYGLASVSLTYLLAGNALSQGKFPGFSLSQIRHLDVLGSCVCAAIAFHYWLGRYELLYSTRGATYGASFTDVTVDFPVYTALSLGSAALSLILLWQAIFFTERRSPWRPLRLGGSLISGAILYLSVIAIATYAVPAVVQRLVVEPNELAREIPYIQHSIAYTRQAFDLARIEAETFNPQPTLTAANLQDNDLTIRNIRLWDTRPLLETNRQLQQIRTYYSFANADIDRYTLVSALPGETTERRQTIIAARELDYRAIPQQAQTWVNRHLVYTHGYGFTLSPVNTVAAGGLPDYFIQNIGVDTAENGSLQIANEQIRASIPIGQPRIYYGEITDNYIMTGTRVQELDYPSGNENVYTTYDGRGGVNIGSFWRRVLFAQYLKDWQMLLTQDFTPQTQVLFRRNIRNRVQAIAPFLRYDRDPYLVAADGGNTNLQGENTYLYWILDAYTTSDRYPYSDPGDDDFNYIRNSVKVVIDAYNGSVDFYIADPTDPVINTISALFPGLLKPLDAMPAALRSHIRYPIDLFGTQSEHLLTYHMTDAQVFYNREDLWRFPTEIYGNEPQQVQPYFLIMRLPTEESEEFVLLLPFNPIQRPNLIGWLAARSDGEQYGRLLLYEFPKQVLVYGPEQVEARINQDPVISQQITLWNRQGSRVIQGNLLVIPIEESLLYVEPLYLEAEQNSLPTFVRVIVAYENRIVMAETLQQALDAVFQPETTPASPIVRPVEDN